MTLTRAQKYNKRKQDELNGKLAEDKVYRQVKKKFPTVKRFKDKYSRLDFIDPVNKIVFELKSAFSPHGELKSYMVGRGKFEHYVTRYKKRGYRFVLLYNIIDNIVFCDIDDVSIFRQKVFRRDNGIYLETKIDYFYVPREHFTKFEYQYSPEWTIGPLKITNEDILSLFHD